MKIHDSRPQTPLRHGLTDPRSCAGPAPQGRRAVLNDRRSTRGDPRSS